MKTASLSRNLEVNTVTAQLNGGFIKIYTGSQPASPEDIATGTLLSTLQFGNPAYNSASSGMAVANAITEDVSAAATGTPGWFRCLKSDGVTAVLDGSIGTSANPSDVNFPASANPNVPAQIQANSEVRITSLDYVLPE